MCLALPGLVDRVTGPLRLAPNLGWRDVDVVALLAAAAVTEVGKQAALMAPTEILARQHIKTIAPLAERAGLRVAILTGREKGRARKDVLDRLEQRVGD